MDLSDLNPAQQAAVTAPDGPHLVIAGAGTGKTKTLTYRVAWLLHQGVPPQNIVLLTFTRRAAKEMLERVTKLAGPVAERVQGGTFHAFAQRILRRHADKIGFSRGFTLLDRADAEDLVGLAREELGLGGKDKRFPRKNTILSLISKSINTGRTIPELVEDEYPQYLEHAEAVIRVGERYTIRKQENAVLDYDDLLVFLDRLLKDHDAPRRQIAGAARHVLVDEYQDVNRLQARISALLSSEYGNLMVVGDEAQAIYGFRGSAVRHILDFQQIFPDAQRTILDLNYRSFQPILDLANGVLATTNEGFDKQLRSCSIGGNRPVQLEVFEEMEQADAVVRQVLGLRESGMSLQQQAVLFRSSSHANLLEVALTEAGIPFRKFGGIRFAEAAHIKDVFALLRVIENPKDFIAWNRILTWLPGLGIKTAQTISTAIVNAEPPRLDPSSYVKRAYYADLVGLLHFLNEVDELRPDLPAMVDRVLSWYRDRMPQLHEDWKKRTKDLDTIHYLAERAPSLDQLLADVTLDPIEESESSELSREDEILTLSTIHSAKGLEWDVVYLIQLGDGAFPSGYSLEDAESLDEERRLLYVAVTRAKKQLYLLAPRFLRQRYGPSFGPGCALLDEIPRIRQLVDRGRIDTRADTEATGQSERLKRILDYFEHD